MFLKYKGKVKKKSNYKKFNVIFQKKKNKRKTTCNM